MIRRLFLLRSSVDQYHQHLPCLQMWFVHCTRPTPGTCLCQPFRPRRQVRCQKCALSIADCAAPTSFKAPSEAPVVAMPGTLVNKRPAARTAAASGSFRVIRSTPLPWRQPPPAIVSRRDASSGDAPPPTDRWKSTSYGVRALQPGFTPVRNAALQARRRELSRSRPAGRRSSAASASPAHRRSDSSAAGRDSPRNCQPRPQAVRECG